MQAARGTPLTSPAPATGEPGTPAVSGGAGRHRRVLGVFAATAVVLYVADQVTKWLAVDRLTDQPDRPLVGELLQLNLVRNPGAAFSTGTAFTEVLTVISITAALVVLYLSRRLGSLLWAVALGVLLAGVVGNLTDRMLRQPGPMRGHVVDFLMLPNWPIFNIADVCINVAAGLIVVQAFRGVRLDGSAVSDDGDDHHHGDGDDDGDGEGKEKGKGVGPDGHDRADDPQGEDGDVPPADSSTDTSTDAAPDHTPGPGPDAGADPSRERERES